MMEENSSGSAWRCRNCTSEAAVEPEASAAEEVSRDDMRPEVPASFMGGDRVGERAGL